MSNGSDTQANPQANLQGALEVVDARSAQEFVAAMESRGDFKYKGIKKIYDQIADATANYVSRGILPGLDQLIRDAEMPEERVHQYVSVMLGRGESSQSRLIFYLPALSFISGSNTRVDAAPVFCRPTQAEGTSARKYLSIYNDKNYKALEKWISGRPSMLGSKLKDYLMKALQAGRLRDTQARNELVKYFYTDLDDNPERRKLSYTLFARPVLQKLVDERKLLLYKGQAPNGRDISGVFYPNMDELNDRIHILGEYFFQNITKDGGEYDADRLSQVLSGFDGTKYESIGESDRQVVDELLLCSGAVVRHKKESVEREKKKSVEEAMEMLAKMPRVAEAAVFKGVDDETLGALRGVNGVLHTEFPYRGAVTDFFLHKTCVEDAVRSARESFDNQGDDTQVRILAAMGLQKYLSSDQYKAFLDLEQRVLFQQIPLVQRIWRMLFGRTKLDQKEVVKIKNKIQADQDKEKVRLRELEARKAQKKLAAERLQAESEAREVARQKVDGDSGGGFGAPEPEDPAEVNKKLEAEQDAKDRLKKICDILDEAWSANKHPNRTDLVERLGDMSEDDLIMFLKKYGRKEVLSFRVRSEKPEYVWPILVSRRYLRRNGKKLHGQVKDAADKQRQANMPDQEKFNIATSIEDFLGRVLPKL